MNITHKPNNIVEDLPSGPSGGVSKTEAVERVFRRIYGAGNRVPILMPPPRAGTEDALRQLTRMALDSLVLPGAASNYRVPADSIVVKARLHAQRGYRVIVESLLGHFAGWSGLNIHLAGQGKGATQ